MDAAWFAIVIAVVGPIGALAFKSEHKWRIFRSFVSRALLWGLALSGGLGCGLWIAHLFPQDVEATLRAFTIGAVACFVALLLVELANWLREP